MKSLLQDLRLALRSLRREPTSAVITSLTLALGIGLCTISYSLVYGVFLRGMDVPEADRLTLVFRSNPSRGQETFGVTMHDLADWRVQQTSFEGLAHYTTGTVNLSGVEGPERYDGGFVSANVFDLLRVQPVVGTGFRPGDDATGAPLTVVLGHRAWETRYHSDPGVVGKSVTVNGEAATILGVMPKGFQFPQDQQIWVARRDDREQNPDRARSPTFRVFARLNPGVSIDEAQLEMAMIADRLAAEYPESNEGVTTRFRSFVEDDTGPELIAVFGAMQVATIFVLLIACANVANLLMARATLRTREAAVRSALGASKLRVVLPFFAETLILAGTGAALGMGIAYVGVTLFDGATQTVGKPWYMKFALDAPVMLFVVGVTLFTALIAGAAPAFHTLRTNVNSTLKDETGGTSGVLGGRLTRVLVTAEIALSCALLIGAGLMVKSIVKLRNFEFPYATESVFTARIGLFQTDYPTTEARREFYTNLTRQLEGVPAVTSVAMMTNLPINNFSSDMRIEGKEYATKEEYDEVQGTVTSPRYFETFQVAMIAGRDFDLNDDAESLPVAIVNQAFAAKYFPGREPIGQRFAERAGRDSVGTWMTIVGVVPDLRMEGFDFDRDDPAGYYVPLAQRDPRFVSLALGARAGVDPLSLTSGVREAVQTVDPNLPIYEVRSMQGAIDEAGWFYWVFGTLFIVFGAAALFMATVGLYGVLAFSVSRRMRELGIRMALGANARDVVRLVVRQGGLQMVVGLAIGLLMAYGLTRVIGILMFEITPQDPPVFTLVVLVIATAGLLASLVPARRATGVNPIVALRYD